MNPSQNLFIVGATGAGKTSIGRRLSVHYELPFVDIDQLIEHTCGVSVTTVFELEGEAGFRQREATAIDDCSQHAGVIMATGAGAVLAAHNRALLMARGYVVWLQTSIEQQLERLERDHHRPLLQVADRHGRLQAMAQIREPFYREIADLVVPGEHGTVAGATERCIALIDQYWQRQPLASTQQTA